MRVLVTRPREQGERTAERLLALGHEPFCAPLLTIRPTLQPAPSGGFDALIVTSANAIATLISWPHARSLPVYAVGAQTAALVREAGFETVRAAEGDASSLAGLVRRSEAAGARLLHIAGRDRKPEPQAALARAG